MGFETAFLKQCVVVWALDGNDDNGDFKVSDTPEQYKARWEKSEAESASDGKTPVKKPLTIYLAEDVEIGAQVWLGKLADLPTDPSPLWQVDGFEKIPSLKPNKYQRTATLMRK